MSISPITFGNTIATTIEFQVAPRDANACVMSFKGTQPIQVYYNNRYLHVAVGGQVIRMTGVQLTNNAWNHVAIVLINIPSNGSTNVQVWINGINQTARLNTNAFQTLVQGIQRSENYFAFCPHVSGVSAPQTGILRLDEVKIYSRALSSNEIQNAAANPTISPVTDNSLVVYFPFNEGRGNIAAGLSGPNSAENYVATLFRSFFTTRNDQETITCQSTGDPHVVDRHGKKWDPTHATNFARLASCKEGNTNIFDVTSHHDFGHPRHPKATLNRLLHFRLGNDILKLTLESKLYHRLRTGPKNSWTEIPLVSQDIGGFRIRVNGNKVFVYGPPYGYVRVDIHGPTHFNVWITLIKEACHTPGLSHCEGHKGFIPEWEFEFDDNINAPLFPNITNPEEQEIVPCEDFPEFEEYANDICRQRYPNNENYFQNCVFDICVTGDPGTGTDVDDEECLIQYRKLIEEGREDEAAQLDCNPECNCRVGTCETIGGVKQCVCNEGWGGKDCSQKTQLLNLTMSYDKTINNMAYQIAPHQTTGIQPALAASFTPQQIAELNSWVVRDSYLIYINSMPVPVMSAKRNDVVDQTRFAYTVYVVGESDAKVNHRVDFTTSATFSSHPLRNVVFGGSGTTRHAIMSYDGIYTNGFFLNDLTDDWCINFNFGTLPSSIKQVVVGSGTVGGQLEILRVHDSDVGDVKICGNEIINPCVNLNTCDTCMANDQCGWCRSTGRCVFGNAAGPTDGSMCPYWSFTDSPTVSRRVKAHFGAPINPKKQEVFLVTGDHTLATLPVQIVVDAGYAQGAAWDLAFLTPSGGNAYSISTSMTTSILNYLNSLPDFGFSFNVFGDNGLTQVSGLETIARALGTLPTKLNNLGSTPTVNPDLLGALNAITAGQNPGWRENARRVVLVLTDNINPSTISPAAIESLRNRLLDKGILPVFAVNSEAQKTLYNTFVNQLGFGLVVRYANDAQLLNTVVQTLEQAGGTVALIPRIYGHLDGDLVSTYASVWNVHGLGDKMRTRMYFPFHSGETEVSIKETTFMAPGFGSASVVNIPSDRPYGTAQDILMKQEVPLDSNPNVYGQIVTLSGRGLDASSPVFLKVTRFGNHYIPVSGVDYGRGKFYQYDDELISSLTSQSEIDTVLEEITGEAVVKDPAGRIFYVPPGGAYSVSGKEDEAYIDVYYTVHDACTKSDEESMSIYIIYQNTKPIALTPGGGFSGNENTAIVLELTGEDARGHNLDFYMTDVPHEYVGTLKQTRGRFFQYTSALADALNVADIYLLENLEDILATGTHIEPSSASPVKLNENKVIYIPDRFFNSENKPASGLYQALPDASFYVQQRELLDHEIDDVPEDYHLLRSLEASFKININWVNQKPQIRYTGGDPQFLLPLDDETDVCYIYIDGGCVFKQNLNVAPPDQAPPTPILMGAFDIEEMPVNIEITGLQCGGQNELIDHGGANLVVGSKIYVPQDDWFPAVRFKPNLNAVGNNYCTISYKAYDGELYSANEEQIVIHLTPVNQPPISIDQYFIAFNTTVYDGQAGMYDVEMDNIHMYVVGCDHSVYDEDDYEITLNGVVVKCSEIPAGGLYFGTFVPVTNFYEYYPLTFHLKDLSKFEEGTWQTLIVQYRDDEVRSFYRDYRLHFTYVGLNTRPVIWRGDSPLRESEYYEVVAHNPVPAEPLPLLMQFDDDTLPTDSMDIGFDIDPPSIDFCYFDVRAIPTNVLINHYHPVYRFHIEGSKANLNNYLQYVDIYCDYPVEFSVKMVLSDQGRRGSCNASTTATCHMYAYATLDIKVVDGVYISPLAVAAGSAGAILVAGAAAVVAWLRVKKLRNNSEGVNPWMLEGEQDNVVDNPMYESTGNEGDNPLYENAQ